MECIKTGCVAHLENYGELVRRDLFRIHNNLVFMRVCQRNLPNQPHHANIYRVNFWFDEAKTSGAQNSSLFGNMDRFDYDGRPL